MRWEIAVCLLLFVLTLPAGGVAGEDPDTLVVREVTVTPAPPEAGEEFTVEARIENAAGIGYEITTVSLLDPTGDELRTEFVGSGSLTPGVERTVQLDGEIDEAGSHQLRLHVAAQTDDGARVSVQHQFRVAVGGDHPKLDIDADRGRVGTDNTVTVTVANGLETSIRSLDVDISGQKYEVTTGPHVRPRLRSGESASYAFSVTPEMAGRRTLVATLAYTDANGGRQTVRERSQLTVRPLSTLPDPELAISMPRAYAGTEATATVRVANGRENPLRNLTVRLWGRNLTVRVDRRVRSRLGGGTSTSVAFPVVASEGGVRSASAELSYTDPTGLSRTVRRETTVRFRPISAIPEPDLAVDVEDGIAGAEMPITLEVANPLDVALSDIEVRVSGAGTARRIRPRIAPGESVVFDLLVVPGDPGPRVVEARLNATVHGTQLSVTRERPVRVDPVQDRVMLEARPGEEGAVVEVINAGNVPIEEILLRGRAPNATVSQTVLERVPPGASATAIMNVTRIRDAGRIPLSIDASYNVAGKRGRVNASTTLASNPGAIALTGITVEKTDQGDALRVSGSASNVGLTDARSVVVGMIDTVNVTPVQPHREYFVGTVPASDFVSFDLYATLSENVSTIPVRVTYLVDDERHERIVEVPYDATAMKRGTAADSGSPVLYAGAVGALVLVVAGFVLVSWRNRGE